jgi:hypothetical protein
MQSRGIRWPVPENARGQELPTAFFAFNCPDASPLRCLSTGTRVQMLKYGKVCVRSAGYIVAAQCDCSVLSTAALSRPMGSRQKQR